MGVEGALTPLNRIPRQFTRFCRRCCTVGVPPPHSKCMWRPPLQITPQWPANQSGNTTSELAICTLCLCPALSSVLTILKNDCKVFLRPRKGYVPKVLSTPFRMQVIALSALLLTEDEQATHPLCRIRALRVYTEHSGQFRQSEQLFVSFGGCTKGLPVLKQRLSRWIVNAITLAYNSTRGMASFWAWSSRVSIANICAATS